MTPNATPVQLGLRFQSRPRSWRPLAVGSHVQLSRFVVGGFRRCGLKLEGLCFHVRGRGSGREGSGVGHEDAVVWAVCLGLTLDPYRITAPYRSYCPYLPSTPPGAAPVC